MGQLIIDITEKLAKVNLESKEKRNILISRYDKPGLSVMNEDELIDFLEFLKDRFPE